MEKWLKNLGHLFGVDRGIVMHAFADSLQEGFAPGITGTSGKNDFGRFGYGGPCPPKGPARLLPGSL